MYLYSYICIWTDLFFQSRRNFIGYHWTQKYRIEVWHFYHVHVFIFKYILKYFHMHKLTQLKIQLIPFHSVVWQSNIRFLSSFMNNEFVVYGTKPWYWIHTKIFLLNTGFVNIMIHNCKSILFTLFAIKLKKNSGYSWMKVVFWTIIPFYFIFRVLIYKYLSHGFQLYCNKCLHPLLPSEQILLMDHSLCLSQSLFQNIKHAFQKVLPVSLTLFKRPICRCLLY